MYSLTTIIIINHWHQEFSFQRLSKYAGFAADLKSCCRCEACCLPGGQEFIVVLFPASSLEDWTHIADPSPDDQIVVSLKALTDECVHGRNYCRQVLCLYELSKVLLW